LFQIAREHLAASLRLSPNPSVFSNCPSLREYRTTDRIES